MFKKLSLKRQGDYDTIVRDWLDAIAYTCTIGDLEGHMDLISAEVQVYGVIKDKIIDYKGWLQRRKNEFDQNLLHSITYRNPSISSATDSTIIFTITEKMKANNGHQLQVEKEVTLVKERDRRWRVVMENITDIEFSMQTPPQERSYNVELS